MIKRFFSAANPMLKKVVISTGIFLSGAATVFAVYEPLMKIFRPDNLAIIVSRGYELEEESLYTAISNGDFDSAERICSFDGIEDSFSTPYLFAPLQQADDPLQRELWGGWGVWAARMSYLRENVAFLSNCKAFNVDTSCRQVDEEEYYLGFYNIELFNQLCSNSAVQALNIAVRQKSMASALKFCSNWRNFGGGEDHNSLKMLEHFNKVRENPDYERSEPYNYVMQYVEYWPTLGDMDSIDHFCEQIS